MCKIKKITKSFGEKIGSTESYSSFNFDNCSIEVEVDIDLDTEEGKEEFKKVQQRLFKAVKWAHDKDVEEAAKAYPELNVTLQKKGDVGLR